MREADIANQYATIRWMLDDPSLVKEQIEGRRGAGIFDAVDELAEAYDLIDPFTDAGVMMTREERAKREAAIAALRKTVPVKFYDPRQFLFAEQLRSQWREIRDEYVAVQEQMKDWPQRDLYDGEWMVYGIYDFPQGELLSNACPLTTGLLAKVPRHGAGGFSRLRAGTNIKPHTGYQGEYLRLHIGLIVPSGDCALCVGGEERQWAEGVALVFDDRIEHSAWNKTQADRVVLLVDFVP